MRILFVTYRFPAHTHDAPSNTVYHLVKYFAERGHDVSLVSLAASRELAARQDLVRPYCRRIETVVLPRWRSAIGALVRGVPSRAPLQMAYFRSADMVATVRRVIREERIDVAYAYHLRAAQYLAEVEGVPRCVALQPAQVLHFGRRRAHIRHPLLKLAYAVEHARLVGYEAQIAARFERCLLISDTDWQAIDPRRVLTNVCFSPHGVDCDGFAAPAGNQREPSTLVFSGALGMDTNSDAILYFCREVYPLVKQAVPGVRLFVVGKQPPAAVRALAADPTITVTGFVDDIRPYLWRATVGIDPLRIGAGLQNKVLEGMAAGLPMVVTTVANEGIGATPGRDVLVGDDPAAFARVTISLLQNAAERRAIAAASRRFVTERWSWEAYFQPLERLMVSLVAPPKPVDSFESGEAVEHAV